PKRAQQADEIVPKIRAALNQRTAVEWEELFGEKVPCSAVRGIDQMFDHPQVAAEKLVNTFEHPTVGSYRGFAGPLKFSAAPTAPPEGAPALGQHAREILAKCGYSALEVDILRKKGVI